MDALREVSVGPVVAAASLEQVDDCHVVTIYEARVSAAGLVGTSIWIEVHVPYRSLDTNTVTGTDSGLQPLLRDIPPTGTRC